MESSTAASTEYIDRDTLEVTNLPSACAGDREADAQVGMMVRQPGRAADPQQDTAQERDSQSDTEKAESSDVEEDVSDEERTEQREGKALKRKREAQERLAKEERAKAELAQQAEEVGNVFTRSYVFPLASEHSSSVAQEFDAEF
jgi:hypothetical protein